MKKLILSICALAILPLGTQAKQNNNTVSVISYNIRMANPEDGDNQWDKRKQSTLKMFAATEPDLVGMQEVLPEQMEYLKANLQQEYTFLGIGRDDGVSEGEMMAVMFKNDRFDMIENGYFWLSETPDKVSRGWDAACNRMVTWVRLKDKKSGKTVSFFNTHFDHMGAQAQEESSRLIIRMIDGIAKNKDAVILTGDFNLEPDDPAISLLFKNFISARDKAKITDRHGTFNDWGKAKEGYIIDYIFCRRAKPIIYKTITEGYGSNYISDHYPISSIIKLK